MKKHNIMIVLLQILLAWSITAQMQYPRKQQRASTQVRRSPQVLLPKPEEYLSDLTMMSQEAAKTQPQPYPSIDRFLARGISKITLDINRIAPSISPYLAQADNIVYGPVTIAATMALVLLGALGQTFNEISNFLGFSTGLNIFNYHSGMQEEFGRLLQRLETTSGLDIGQTVNFAMGIFTQDGYAIRPEYQQAASAVYKTDIINLDFQGNPGMAQMIINGWVSDRTNTKIPMLLTEPPPPNTKTILASVLYFKAPWEYPFFDGHTKLRPFYTNGRKNPTNKMAQMMVNGGEFPYYKDTTLGVEILGFPYKGGQTSMYVILPMESNVEKLKRLESLLTAADIERLVASTKITEAVVVFPKMRLENTLELSTTMQRLGVNSLFNPYSSNLGLMSPGFMKTQKAPEAPFVSNFPNRQKPPAMVPQQEDDDDDRLIFTRFGDQTNCAMRYDTTTNKTNCIHIQTSSDGLASIQSLERLRQALNANLANSNPGLYADQIIHKVFIDITESGTEAAAATGVSLNRSGGRITFRVDMPFLFFIYHENTRIILFFGSVKTPTPIETS